MKTKPPKRVIEDRTKHRPGTSMAGYYVVWEEVQRPFPHRVYCGHYETREKAEKAAGSMLKKERTP